MLGFRRKASRDPTQILPLLFPYFLLFSSPFPYFNFLKFYSWQRLAAGAFAHVLFLFICVFKLFIGFIRGKGCRPEALLTFDFIVFFFYFLAELIWPARKAPLTILFPAGFVRPARRTLPKSFSCRAHLACPESSANNPLFGKNPAPVLFDPLGLQRITTDIVRSRRRRWRVFGHPRRVFFPKALQATEFLVPCLKIFRISQNRRDFLFSGTPLNFVSCLVAIFFFLLSRSGPVGEWNLKYF